MPFIFILCVVTLYIQHIKVNSFSLHSKGNVQKRNMSKDIVSNERLILSSTILDHFGGISYLDRASHRSVFSLQMSKDSDNNEDESITKIMEKENNLLPSYITLFMILATFTSNQWSRQALYYLCDFSESSNPLKHINADLGFDKEQYAFLASVVFTSIFATVSFFAGGIADNNNRRVIIGLSCFLWSAATLAQAQVVSYEQLLPLRVLIGFSQAFFNPAAYTLIADIFPKDLVGRMNGILSGGVYLGGGLASLSILLDNSIGWRSTITVIGLVGMSIAAIGTFVIKEPRDTTSTSTMVMSSSTTKPLSSSSFALPDMDTFSRSISIWLTSVREILLNKESTLLLLAAMARFGAGFTIGIWKAPFVFDKFPADVSLFAGSNAAIVSIGGLLSSVAGGYISDYISKTRTVSDSSSNNTDGTVTVRPPIARVWVAAIGSLLAAPTWAGFILAQSPVEASAWLLAEYLVAECWIGPTLAALFESVGSDRRGTAQGVFSLTTAAGNLMPLVVGALTSRVVLASGGSSSGAGGISSDHLTAWGFSGLTSGSSLGDVLLYTVSGLYLLSAGLFAAAAWIRDDKQRATTDLSNDQKIN